MDSYHCLSNLIATFHSLSDFGAVISGYPNIVLIISLLTFFFNKKIMCILSVSCYDLKSLEFRQKNNSCIGVTQENLIENSFTD